MPSVSCSTGFRGRDWNRGSGWRRWGTLALACLLSLVSSAAEAKAEGVNWQRRVIKATGQAAPDQNAPNIAAARLGAERAARVDAMRNLLETLKGVQVSGTSTAADSLTDPGVSAKVQGILRNFKVVDTRYFSDGGVEIDVEMPLDGLLETLVAPGNSASRSKNSSDTTTAKAESAGKAGSKKAPSGLVVDVRELDFVPAMAPRIVDEDGNELYGPSAVEPKKLSQGLAAYTADLEEAQKDPRIDSGVVVKAIALAQSRSEVVVSKDDAARVRTLSLESGNVVFVIR